MSLEQFSARDNFLCRHIFSQNFDSKNHKHQPTPGHKHAAIKPMLELAKTPLAGPQAPTTKVLHDAHDGRPSITLTSYTTEFRGPASPTAVSKAPASSERLVGPHNEQPALKCELDEYFLGLKGEFEEKTGKVWVPLRGWAREEWEWENQVDDEVAVQSWGIV
jgi:hypothetical protein